MLAHEHGTVHLMTHDDDDDDDDAYHNSIIIIMFKCCGEHKRVNNKT